MKLLRGVGHVRSIGGGSIWRGVIYLCVGLFLLTIFLSFLPHLLLALIPDVILTGVSLLFMLAVLGTFVYLGATVYEKLVA
jgi:hypothetical protein